MDIKEDDGAPLILRRQFMKTARMMIDMDDGKTKMRVEDGFNLFEAMKHYEDNGVCFKMDTIDESIRKGSYAIIME